MSPTLAAALGTDIKEENTVLKLTFIGHSAFALDDGDAANQILIDPFISGNPVATSRPDDYSPATILLTHGHGDHVGDTVAIAKRTGATVIAVAELAGWLESEGVKAHAANHGGTVAFAGGTVKLTPAWHSSSYGPDWRAPSVPAGLIVRFGGKTVYFAGDTCLFGDMRLIGEAGLDAAVLPIGDNFTMGIDDAARAVEFLGSPATIIPCHFNTFPPIQQDGGAFKSIVESRTSSKVLILSPSESTEL